MKKIYVFYHINLDNNSAGGIINFLRGLLESLNNFFDFSYYTMNYSRDIDFININQIFLKKMDNNPNEKIKIPNNLIFIWELIKLFIRKKFNEDDILFFQRSEHILPALLLRKQGKKVLIIHGSSQYNKFYYEKSLIKRKITEFSERTAIKKFDKVILVSKEAYDYYYKLNPNYKNNLMYIPTFVNTELFKAKNLLNLNENEPLTFIYYGRLVKEKGIEYFREFFKYLEIKNIDYKAYIIGEGELDYYFDKLNNVEVIKTLPQSKIIYFLHKKAILLMFSKGEGTPLTLLESLATGTPAICTRVGEMSKIIEDGKNGYLFKNIKDNYDEILIKSKFIFDNYEIFSKQAVDSVKNYSLSTITNEYKALFENL